jgi:3-oxoacyl-[acyl-carrier-protein] synthase II
MRRYYREVTSAPRVVISGIGVMSCFGVGRECFWTHVSRGISGTRAITEFDVSAMPCRVAAPAPPVSIANATMLAGEDDPAFESYADPRRYSRAALFAVIAAREAWNDAGLRAGEPNAGVLIGSGGGGIDVGEAQYRDFFTNGGRHVTPYAIAIGIVGMLSSELSISLGLRGISHVVSTGCTSSTDAIGYAVSLLREGELEVVLSGGADGCVTPGMIFGFSRMRAVSTHYNDRGHEASRPFDRGRDGFVLGEGAWMLVLEREDRARARGARVYAAIEGYASTCDAYHRVQMDPDGAEIVACIEGALRKSGRAREEIGYINYHGTSTVLNDAVEARCVRRVFGSLADGVPGSSTKSVIGHPQGACGAAGVVASALALSRRFLPPTANLQDPDPQCDMDFIPVTGREADPQAALCNCLGFGSKNSALVLGCA